MQCDRQTCLDAGMKAGELQTQTVRGAAATWAARDWRALALDQGGRAGDLASAGSTFAELSAEFERLRQAMESSALLGKHESQGNDSSPC